MAGEEGMLKKQAAAGNGSAVGVIIGFAFAALVFHLLVNALGGYGIFRDEYYYIACSKRLAPGYVDHPPLAMFFMAAGRLLFGAGQFGIRVLPGLSHALTVALAGLIARRLGGRRAAVALACLAVFLAPIIIGHCNIFQMNAFAYLFWALAAWLLVAIAQESRPRLWLLLGVVMGLGLLNKIDFLWLGLGLAVALLLTDWRRHLATPWPWAAAAIALLLFSPFVAWNAAHGFPHLEFIRNATAAKYAGLTRGDFLVGQLMLPNPVNFFLWFPGLLFLLFRRQGRAYRVLGIIFLTAFMVLLANPHSKAEYLGPAYPMLFAAGAVAWERWAEKGRRRLWLYSFAGLGAAVSLLILPFAVPVLPVESYIRYAVASGMPQESPEGKRLAELPQFYADMFGWEELARDVSAVYLSLPPAEQESAVVLGRNYGHAAALEYYATKYPLPPAISTHNSYWFWGYPRWKAAAVIVLGGDIVELRRRCADVCLAALHSCRYCLPNENGMPIHVCRGLRQPLSEFWQANKSFH
jgi:hypothetical protein